MFGFIKRYPIVLIFTIGLIALVAWVFQTYQERSAVTQQNRWGSAPLVVTEEVRVGDLVDQVESIGTLQANESVMLTAKVTDTVSKVNFDDGQYVEAGTILVELTNSEETALLSEAQTNVSETSRQYERVKNLIQQNLASETQLDVEQSRMQTALARLEGIVARLNDRLIRAPFGGVLGFRDVSPGTLLTPTTTVTTLDDISIVKLDFAVPENYLAKIVPGLEVIARSGAYEDLTFTGVVRTVNSRIDPVTRTIQVRAHLPNDDRLLRPGMLMTVQLIRTREQVVLVPEEAVVPIQDKHYVYVVEDGTAQRREITPGRRRPGVVEVLAGLTPGDPVITQGVIKVRPGGKVRTADDAKSAPGQRPGAPVKAGG